MQGVSKLFEERWIVNLIVSLFDSFFVLIWHVLILNQELLTNWNLILCIYINLLHLCWQGGGFYISGGEVSVTACTITSNYAVSNLFSKIWIIKFDCLLFESCFLLVSHVILSNARITNKLKFNYMYIYEFGYFALFFRIVGYAACK